MRDQNNISLKKVIKGMECCLGEKTGVCPVCTICPYGKDTYATRTCEGDLRKDALTLLKVQEPVEYVVHCKNADLSNGIEFACGECGGSLLHKKVNYCPWCGRAVKWEP